MLFVFSIEPSPKLYYLPLSLFPIGGSTAWLFHLVCDPLSILLNHAGETKREQTTQLLVACQEQLQAATTGAIRHDRLLQPPPRHSPAPLQLPPQACAPARLSAARAAPAGRGLAAPLPAAWRRPAVRQGGQTPRAPTPGAASKRVNVSCIGWFCAYATSVMHMHARQAGKCVPQRTSSCATPDSKSCRCSAPEQTEGESSDDTLARVHGAQSKTDTFHFFHHQGAEEEEHI